MDWPIQNDPYNGTHVACPWHITLEHSIPPDSSKLDPAQATWNQTKVSNEIRDRTRNAHCIKSYCLTQHKWQRQWLSWAGGSFKTKTVQDSLALTKHRRLVSLHLTSIPIAFKYQSSTSTPSTQQSCSHYPQCYLNLCSLIILLTQQNAQQLATWKTAQLQTVDARPELESDVAGESCTTDTWLLPTELKKSCYLKHDSIIAMLACDSTM